MTPFPIDRESRVGRAHANVQRTTLLVLTEEESRVAAKALRLTARLLGDAEINEAERLVLERLYETLVGDAREAAK